MTNLNLFVEFGLRKMESLGRKTMILISSLPLTFISVENFYNENQKFPDSAWLKLVFKDKQTYSKINK